MNVVAEMLLSSPAPVLWFTMLALCLPALVVLANPDAIHNPGQFVREAVNAYRRVPQPVVSEASPRYADEVRVAAERAELSADRWQEHWEQAVLDSEHTWQAWQDAQARLVQTRAASAWGTPATPQTPAEYADRERYLHLAVRAAVARGELPTVAIADALAGRGWDAGLHPADQELAIHRAAAAHLHQVHRRAAATEQTLRHDADLAARTRDALLTETLLTSSLLTGARTTGRPVVVPVRPARFTPATTAATIPAQRTRPSATTLPIPARAA